MRQGNTILGQVQALLPRSVFQSVVARYRGDHKVHFVGCWALFWGLLWAQITQRRSLREIELIGAHHAGLLQACGVSSTRRATLSRAQTQRPWPVAAALFERLVGQLQQVTSHQPLACPLPRFALDATVIDLCQSQYGWAEFRRHKSGIRLHILWEQHCQAPMVAIMTPAVMHEVRVARTIPLEPGSILCVDRGYLDFAWFWQLQEQQITVITRPKCNQRFRIVERRKVKRSSGVTSDHVVRLTGPRSRWFYPGLLRHIRYVDPDDGKVWTVLTTNLDLPAATIVQLYRERWQIEEFFRWIKQNLKIKTFYGRSPNAVLWQIFTALCLYLILAYLKAKMQLGWSLRQLHALLNDYLYRPGGLDIIPVDATSKT